MSQEGKFWVSIWAVAVGALTMIICTAVISSYLREVNENAAAVEMVKNGADPMDATCAVNQGTERYCEMRVMSKR
jgi:hypothetical protein